MKKNQAPVPTSSNFGSAIVLRGDTAPREKGVETLAWTLLRRYGVVFRRLIARETEGVPWRELARVYRRLEARGEIRGGRFVSGMPGEQFALADAVDRLREVRRSAPDHALVTMSAADPLNLVGILTPEARVAAIYRNRILFKDGLPIAAVEGGQLRRLADSGMDDAKLRTLLARRSLRHPPRPHLRTPTPAEVRRLELDRKAPFEAVAKALHVHPQTVRYRLARLRELFGTRLDDPDGRFELELALRARRIAG